MGIGSRARKASGVGFLTNLLYRAESREFVGLYSGLKAKKVSVYKAFRAFGRGFLKASAGVFRKIKKAPCKFIQNALIIPFPQPYSR